MSPDQVRLVQASWAQVAPIADKAAALFYGRLFELDPSHGAGGRGRPGAALHQ